MYDLLNPAAAGGTAPPGGPQAAFGRGGAKRPGGLRLRWLPGRGFYLEDVTVVACASADEALAAFRAGVRNKARACAAFRPLSSFLAHLCLPHVLRTPLRPHTHPTRPQTPPPPLPQVMAGHRLNHASSRSHALFQLSVTVLPKDRRNDSEGVLRSKLTLVDLAGASHDARASLCIVAMR